MEPTKIMIAQQISPSSSSSNFIGEGSMTKTPEIPNPKDIKSEDNLNDEKPLDLSMAKSSKPIYVLDSDEEAGTIVIDDDEDDDNKEHLQKFSF